MGETNFATRLDMALENVSEAFYRVNALNAEQRDAAYAQARKRIAGAMPMREAYERQGISKYPREVTRTIVALCVVMLIAAFLPSAMRLHQVGLDAFALTIAHPLSQYVAALCAVLMAEVGQVIFSLASATNAETRAQRYGLIAGAAICTLIALIGNYVASQEHLTQNAFAPLETFAPPILVLITSQILKSQMLHAIEARYAAQAQYTLALDAWNASVSSAHEQAAWERMVAAALQDELRSANKGRGASVVRELTKADWYALVLRERSDAEWYDAADAQMQARIERLQVPVRSGVSSGATGEVAAQAITHDGSVYSVACPHCTRTFEGATHKQAQMRLTAHFKAHANEQRKMERAS